MHEETMSLNYCNTRNHINDLRYAKRVKKKNVGFAAKWNERN